jgi:hypothetical protein
MLFLKGTSSFALFERPIPGLSIVGDFLLSVKKKAVDQKKGRSVFMS